MRPMDVISVWIAPGADLGADPGTWPWVNITHLVEAPITAQVGSTSESGGLTPAEASVTVANWNGDLSPANPLGQWYGQLDTDTPLRIDVAGASNPLYEGVISELPTSWRVYTELVKHARSHIKAAGILDWLAGRGMPAHSALRRHFTSHPDLIAYWPCEDGSGARSVSSPIDGVPPFMPFGVDLGAVDGPGGSDRLLRASARAFGVRGRVPNHPHTDRYVYQHAFRRNEPHEDGSPRTMLTLIQTGAAARSWRVRASGTQFLVEVRNSDDDVVISPSQAVSPQLLDRWLRVVLELTQVGSALQWRATAMSTGPDATVFNQLSGSMSSTTLRRVTQCGLSFGVLGEPDRYVGHMALTSGNPDTLTVDQAAFHGYTGERAAERFSRLCAEEGLRCAVIGDPGETMPMGPQRPTSFPDQLDEIRRTEQGRVFERGFALTLRTRADMTNQDDPIQLDIARQLAGDLQAMWDTRGRADLVTVTRPGGGEGTVDRSAQGGRRFPDTLTANPQGDPRLAQLAGWIANLGRGGAYRWPQLPIRTAPFNPQLILPLVQAVPGDRAVVAHPLPQLPGVDIDVLVEGAHHSIESIGWDVTLTCSPAAPWTVWELEHEDRGRLYPTRAVLADGVDAGVTSLEVATTGPPWINSVDHGEQLPLRINIGGEVMQVTAITQPIGSDPAEQTFTVVRGLNGITKPHPPGAEITLHPGHVISL